jgi:hypothetical protein
MMIDEQDYVTDDDIDEMYGDGRHVPQPASQSVTHPAPHPMAQPTDSMNGLPVYPLALAQVPPVAAGGDNVLTRKIGPLPLWGWALTAIGTGIGGYFWWQSSKKVSKNDGDEDRESPRSLPEDTGGGGGGSWSPSRGGFCEQLNKFFARKGMADKVKIFDDADEAKASGKLKHLSPLINIKCDGAYKPDKDLLRLCKREGLNPIAHEDGTIGLYPASSGKRSQEWERYIDLLRDDGQKV